MNDFAVTKACKKCGETKSIEQFSMCRTAPDGRQYSCKSCQSAAARLWNITNRARSNASCLRYKQRNPDTHKNWLAANRTYMNEYMRNWRKTHSVSTPYIPAQRFRKSTPKWANVFFLKEAYRLAKMRSKMLGFQWEVDHIIPLNHPLVCGLHVETNIRVIPRAINRSMGNRGWKQDAPT